MCHAHNRTVDKNVLTAGQIRAEAGAQLNQGRQTSAECNPTLTRCRYARQELDKGGLARAVRAHDAERLPAPDVKTHISERPECPPMESAGWSNCLLANRLVDANRYCFDTCSALISIIAPAFVHMSSTIVGSIFLKIK